MKTPLRALLCSIIFLSSTLCHSMNNETKYEWIVGIGISVGALIIGLYKYSKSATHINQRCETIKLLNCINTHNKSDDTEIFSHIINRTIHDGANPNQKLNGVLKNIQNISAGQLAIKKNVPLSIIQTLIAHGTNFNKNDVQSAAELGHKDIANLLNIWIHTKPRPTGDQTIDLQQEKNEGYIRENDDIHLLSFSQNQLIKRLQRAEGTPIKNDKNELLIDVEALTSQASSSSHTSSSSNDSLE